MGGGFLVVSDNKEIKMVAHLERLRSLIEVQYPMGFGEALCYEIHTNDLHFIALADKWGISVTTLGELIYDHCKRLEGDPRADIQPPSEADL